MTPLPLPHTPLFHSIPTADLEAILSHLNIKERSFAKDEILAMQNEPCNRLIILLSGSVRAEMIDQAGRLVKVEDICAPNPLAILFLFGDNNRFPVQAIANEEVTALVIPRQAVLKMLMMNEKLLKNYLDISSTFATRLSRKLNFMSLKTIRQKLAVYILQLAEAQHTNEVVLDTSRSALADYFGVSRQALERELTNMREDGIIRAEKRRVFIMNTAKLRDV